MRRTWIGSLLVGLIGLSAGGAVGCAQERAPISRVQADALAKSFFVGMKLSDDSDNPEFYARGTVVDVGYGAAQDGLFTSTYAQPVSRIRWHITSDMLIGRISYERLDGSDGKGIGKASNDGVIAYAYPITAHFDIRRDYNPTTGEESNVIVENQSDRTWDQREYMRVDWSRNTATDSYDFDTLSLMGLFGGIKYESMAYYVNNPEDPDAPHFDATTGYFDVTNKAFAKPGLIDLPAEWGGGSFPACFLDNDALHGSAPSGSCDPVELTLRQSFRRVENTDYEAQDWDGERFQVMGAFTEERKGYSRNYGMSDEKWHRFIARYNIWERSHVYTDAEKMTGATECFTPGTTPIGMNPHRDENKDGTEDECDSVGGGSKCDEFAQKCTLPYAKRKEKPIVWYYSNGSNPQFFDGTSWATQDWDVAMRGAVMTARYTECVRIGGDAAKCAADFPMYTGQMGDNEDATQLAGEVDDCRHGVAHQEMNGKGCEALADSVGALRGVSAGVIAIAKMREMVVLCHSPVEATDPEDCAPAANRLPLGITAAKCGAEREKQAKNGDGNAELLAACNGTDERPVLNVRMGDLRYHQVNGIITPQTPSPWGIMVDAVDPLNGEKVQASINVWTHVNDLWSQGVVDTSRYIKGELTTAEVTDGSYVRDWVDANRSSGGNSSLPAMDAGEVKKRIAGFAGVDVKTFDEASEKVAGNPQIQALSMRVKEEVQSFRADAKQPGVMRQKYEARRLHALNSPMEAELMTHAMMEAGNAFGLPVTAEVVKNAVSPLRGANPSTQRDLHTFKEIALAERGACILQEAPAPFAVTGLADVLEEKFGKFNPADDKPTQFARGELMRNFVAQRAQYAVIVHEMGHSIGLRHNFVSSYDAWGYRPQYWQLRTKDGTVTGVTAAGKDDPKTLCKDATTDGDKCIGPRYFDPVSEEERSNLIWMFMQSSVMDYAGETTQDLVGLGAYDYAAAKMFYGDVNAVFSDPSYNLAAPKNAPRAKGILSLTDNFGGITGIQPQIGNGKKITDNESGADDIHYTRLQGHFELIKKCKEVADLNVFKPASWNEKRDGLWHPTLDGHIVKVNGKYTKCEEQQVDYVNYGQLRLPTATETRNSRTSPSVDPLGRVRVPYGFATDTWADTGNLSVFRHDNGADPYELFDFLITQQEVGHIFSNYRRHRTDFSIRGASNRTLERFNEKMRDAAKGLSLYVSIYKDFALEANFDFDNNWPGIVNGQFPENILAAGIAFDHIARMQQRPEPGPHQAADAKSGDKVFRSSIDTVANPGPTAFIVPNGATGYYDNISFGGKPLENLLDDTKGEYRTSYNLNAGDYYDKVYNPMLMAESVDNFISSSRTDYLDGRYRAVSIADLFPDGYRRWLANNLTGDDEIKGPRLAADVNGKVLIDAQSTDPNPDAKLYPAQGIGWTSWWPVTGPESCFPADGNMICSSYAEPNSGAFNPKAPANVAIIDPQVGWEQQKFLIAMTLQYLPENAQQFWLDNLRLWELGADSDPAFLNRIEFHDPTGKVYIAKTFGTEVIFGKTVQKGIAARMIEWANILLEKAYVTTTVTQNGATWYVPVLDVVTGQPIIKYDPSIEFGSSTCSPSDNSGCTCTSNRSCVKLSKYTELPAFMRQALTAYGLADPSMKGIF